MYNVNLKTAHFPVQSDAEIRDITIGDLLREIAAKYPDAIAVQEIDDNGQNARTYTDAALLQESDQLALALSTRFQRGVRWRLMRRCVLGYVSIWLPRVRHGRRRRTLRRLCVSFLSSVCAVTGSLYWRHEAGGV